MYPMVLDVDQLGVSLARIIEALEAEGICGLAGVYVNVHLLPMYQQKIAYGSNGFPWTSDVCKRDVNYAKGICPVAERLHDFTYLGFAMCMHELSYRDIDLIGEAFRKVWNYLDSLK